MKAFVETLKQEQFGDFKPSHVIRSANAIRQKQIIALDSELQLRRIEEEAKAKREEVPSTPRTPEQIAANKKYFHDLIRAKFPKIDERPQSVLHKIGGRDQ